VVRLRGLLHESRELLRVISCREGMCVRVRVRVHGGEHGGGHEPLRVCMLHALLLQLQVELLLVQELRVVVGREVRGVGPQGMRQGDVCLCRGVTRKRSR
jgi:hypothetical protein